MLRFVLSSTRFTQAGEGDQGGGNNAFDPAAFQAQMLATLNSTLAGFAKKFEAKLTPAQPAVKQEDEPTTQPAEVKDPVLAAQFKAMERQNKQLLEQFQAIQKDSAEVKAQAELKERHSSIRDVLAGFQFGSDAQRDTAFRILKDEVRREADGSIVGGSDGAPLKEFVTEAMKSHSYLLAPKEVGGAGARGGRAQGGAKAFDIDSIKPGMSAADLAAASAEIAAALTGR